MVERMNDFLLKCRTLFKSVWPSLSIFHGTFPRLVPCLFFFLHRDDVFSFFFQFVEFVFCKFFFVLTTIFFTALMRMINSKLHHVKNDSAAIPQKKRALITACQIHFLSAFEKFDVRFYFSKKKITFPSRNWF